MCDDILNLVIFNMKKKVLIFIGIITLIIIGLLSYFVISDLMVENKLKNEIYEINEMSNADTIDTDAIYKRLNKIVTKNDYAKVEYTLNGVKYTAKVTIANPNSYSEKAIMEMPKEIANASDIDLIITIRNISYRINLL